MIIERVVALLERERKAKEGILLNGSITTYEQYRTTLSEYQTLGLAIEIAKDAEIDDDEDDDTGMEELGG